MDDNMDLHTFYIEMIYISTNQVMSIAELVLCTSNISIRYYVLQHSAIGYTTVLYGTLLYFMQLNVSIW